MVGKHHKVIEINFPSEKDCLEALGKEFVLQGSTIQVSKALDKNANVLRVSISAIPYKPVEVLKPLLVKTFEQYGDILNVGLCHSKDGDWFTGRGFVTLNIDKAKSYAAELEPQIAFGDFQEKLRLVWTNMQPICKDCHTDDHVKANCPKARRKACHKCGSLEHLIAACPHAHWNRKKEQPTQERRRNSNSQERPPTPKSTGREVNLFDLMKVPQPKYFGKKDKAVVDEDQMDFSGAEPVSSAEPVDLTNDSPVTTVAEDDELPNEDPTDQPVNADATILSTNGDNNDTLEVNQPADSAADGSEYEDLGETSDSSIEFNFKNKYNLRPAKTKASSTVGTTVSADSLKRPMKDLSSTPPGSDQEGPVKKLLRQQEDANVTDDEQGGPSASKSL
jgi:hypothetical protein